MVDALKSINVDSSFDNRLIIARNNNIDNYRNKMQEANGIKYLIMPVEKQDANLLKAIADNLSKDGKSLIFFANIKDNNSLNFICKSTCDINAGLLVKNVSIKTDGNGGGSATFAQGGGKDAKGLTEILKYIEEVIKGYEE